MNWRVFLLLWGLGVFGMLAVIPYALTLQKSRLHELPSPLHIVIPAQVIQNAILIALAVALGLWLGERTGLGAPVIARWMAHEQVRQEMQTLLAASLFTGIGVSGVVVVLDLVVFAPRLVGDIHPGPRIPVFQSILAAFYGGITEEILLHLGLFTLFAWLLGMLSHTSQGLPGAAALWIANVLTAVLFGLGHLPATRALAPLTAVVVIRALLLNGIVGLACGYLYWTFGLVAAMIAHFTIDILLHVVLPFVRW